MRGGVGNCCSNVTIIPCKDGAGVRDTRHGTILSRPWRENNIIGNILDENRPMFLPFRQSLRDIHKNV